MTPSDSQLSQLKKFVIKNHDTVMKYHNRYYNCLISPAKTKCQVIEMLFISSIEASGAAVPVDAKYQSLKNFRKMISPLKDRETIFFNDFIECFLKKYNSPNDIAKLSKILQTSSEYPHFGKKKSKLFFKELVVLGGKDIFSNFNESIFLPYLPVPIDVVIRKVYWSLYGLTTKVNTRNDDKIEELANTLFPYEPILIDDLWFWGHFSFKKDKLLSSANLPMIYTDKYIEEADVLGQHGIALKCNEFIKIITGKVID